jgi:hypothetical protein
MSSPGHIPPPTKKVQPWTTIWPKATGIVPQNATSHGVNYNFEKGEAMVIDGSAQRGSGFLGGEWTVEAESNKPTQKGNTAR